MTLLTDNRVTVMSPSAPSTPRLRMEPTTSHGIVLDGELHSAETDGVDVWETEGGHLAPTSPPTGRDLHMRAPAG
jgi:hypothetical protein